MGTVTLPLIHGQGTPETVWREWLTGQRFPSADLALLVPLGSRLVVVAPHPDDEILACGGLLAACVQSRVPVRVIGLTDGDASHGTDDPLAMRQLAVQRRVESCAGLRVLGLAACNVVRWHIPDGCVRQYQARITQAMIRLLQPSDVVVTPWAMDGHPDHDAAGDAVSAACSAVGCAVLQAPVWMWHWATPGDARVPWSQMVALRTSPAAVELKQQALACHRSQLSPAVQGQAPILNAAIRARALRPVEYFFVQDAAA